MQKVFLKSNNKLNQLDSKSTEFDFQILENSSSLKVCNRVGAVLRRLVLGLLVNEGMTPQDILLLCHGLVSQSLPLLTKRDRYTHTQAHSKKQ